MPADIVHTSEYEFDVFISYSRNDQLFVDWLGKALEGAGLRSFRDTTDLQIFDKIDATLKRHIGRSRFLVAVISSSYLRSYWCLFEAMEALQGQNREQRLVPLVLRYQPDEQSLDEEFVLSALRDLEQQIKSFEMRMVTARAYELGGKLNKLSFVRMNLPTLFNHVQDRIYPQFEMWDASSCEESGRRFLRWLTPDLAGDVQLPHFDWNSNSLRQAVARLPPVAPKLSSMPIVLWSAYVGYCAWKNTPLVTGNDVFVATCGAHWNQADNLDGVRCLDVESGREKWFAHTPADANRVLVTKGLTITGCDDGSIIAWDSRSGVEQWRCALGSGIVGGPLRIPTGMMAHHTSTAKSADFILVVTYLGTLHVLDARSGQELQRRELGKRVIASPKIEPLSYNIYKNSREIYYWEALSVVCDIQGGVHLVGFADGRIRDVVFHSVYNEEGRDLSLEGPDGYSPQLSVSNSEGIVLASYARSTYQRSPALVAFGTNPLRLAWRATSHDSIGHGFGNLRAPPVVLEDEIVLATAYSNELVGLSRETGRAKWSVNLGATMFEQWSGPVSDGSIIYLGRHDGYLHRINARLHRREWSLYLGEHSRAGYALAGDQVAPEFDDLGSWSSGGSAPILATPAVDRGRIYVGTSEGWLYCIGNLGV